MPTPVIVILIVVGVLAIFSVFFGIVGVPFIVSKKVYEHQLVRTSPDKWGRGCSAPDNEEQVRMFNEGEAWFEENKEHGIDVEVRSEGLRLVGKYMDFGFKRACIIIAGRTESYLYSYYFAKPYKEAGFNVLVIDNRAHGESEGKYLGAGLREYHDILEWGKLLHDKFHNEGIYIHGICIGSATAMYVLTSENCPDYYLGMTADGMYTTFYETFKTHMVDMKKPVNPFSYFVMKRLQKNIGEDPIHNGPIYSIPKLKLPLLMIHSKEDVFSLPVKAQELYDKCNSPKKLVWFDKGAHSHIRINNQEKYDETIKEFIKEYIND